MLTIRPAQKPDIDAVKVCVSLAYTEAKKTIPDLPGVASGLEEDLEQHHMFVAETDGLIAGAVVFGKVADRFMVINLAVHPDAQGQGVARQLMDRAEAQAREDGFDKIELRTHRLMTGTRAMYKHLGWSEVEISENKVSMQKAL